MSVSADAEQAYLDHESVELPVPVIFKEFTALRSSAAASTCTAKRFLRRSVPRPPQDLPEEVLVDSVMQGAQGEMIDRLAQLIEAVQQGRQEGETRHTAVIDALQAFALHDALDRHSRQFQALFDLLRGTALWKIWLRALLLTGTAWGGALVALYGYVRGWPF
jgi:hypothetical protein